MNRSPAALVVCAVVLSACAKTPKPPTDDVQSVVRKCGLTGQITFERVGRKLAISYVDQNADFKRFDCVLRGLSARGIEVAFIGSEHINR